MNSQLQNEDTVNENNVKDYNPYPPKEGSKNNESFVVCTYRKENKVANVSKSISQTNQNANSLPAKTESRIKNDSAYFGNNISRIKKAVKKSNLSVLRGPTAEIPQVSLIEYFEEQFSEKSFDTSQPAVMTDTSTFTYASLNNSANQIANILRQEYLSKYENQSLNKDIVIAVCLSPSLKYRIPIIFAILKLGATYLPINHDYPEEKVCKILDGCNAVATITSRTDTRAMDIFQNLEESNSTGKLIYIEHLCRSIHGSPANSNNNAEAPPEKSLEIVNPIYWKSTDRAVCILPSFNSNGDFSGIRHHSRMILNLLLWDIKNFPYENEGMDYVISYFVATPDCMEAIKEIFFPLLTGKTLLILNQNILTHPTNILAHINEYKVVKLVVYPRLLQYIVTAGEILGMQATRTYLSHLKYCFCVGEQISVELATLFFYYAGDDKQLVILYGHDENTSTVTYQAYKSVNHLREIEYSNYIPVGTPINNYKVYIVSRSMELVPIGAVGEICISGLALTDVSKDASRKLMKNIFTKSKSKDYKFLLRTGDYGRIVDNRLVYETGRNKHVYIDEHYFNFDEVTELLNCWNCEINSYHIYLCYQLERDPIPKLILFVDFKSNTEDQYSPLLSYLKNNLPRWAIPEIISITSVPQASLDNNGMITTLLKEYEAQKMKKREYSDWKTLSLVSHEEIKAAKVLLLLLSNVLPVSVKELAEGLSKSIFDFGATAFICLKMVQQLNKIGYHVKMDDIEGSKSMLELISKMVDRISTGGVLELVFTTPKVFDNYQLERTIPSHKDDVIKILAHSYTKKDTLDYFCQTYPKDIKKFLERKWCSFAKAPSSLTLKRLKDKKIVGAILSLDWDDRKLKIRGTSKAISHRLRLQQYLENGYLDLEKDKEKERESIRALQIAHFGLLPNLFNLSELYEITNKMISESIDLAKSEKYNTILMTVYDLYVAELCEVIWGFKLIRECQANKIFTEDDVEPYGEAPDSLICKFMVKEL